MIVLHVASVGHEQFQGQAQHEMPIRIHFGSSKRFFMSKLRRHAELGVLVFVSVILGMSKRRRLAEVAGLTPVSAAGLSRIVKSLQGNMSGSTSRHAIARAIDADLRLDTPYGPVIQLITLKTKTGGTLDVNFCHPGAMLTFLCHYSEHYDKFLKHRMDIQPPSPSAPWSIGMSFDEASAGNMLKVDQTRKAWLIYWAFVDMGKEHLAHESNWMLAGCITTHIANRVAGGFSAIWKALLKEMFFGDRDNVQTTGFLIRGHDGKTFGPIFARWGFVVADEAALHSSWKTKGSSGNVNCMLCCNVVRIGSDLANFGGGYLVDNAESDEGKFHKHTDSSVYAACEKLARCPRAELADLEKALGLHFDADSILYEAALRPYIGPISGTMLDFGHTFIINGLVHFTMTAFLSRARGIGITYNLIFEWFQAWSWPRWERNPPKKVFNEAHAKHSEFRASASECLSMYPVFAAFVEVVIPAGVLESEKACLVALWSILNGWRAYQADVLGPLDRWEAAIKLHHDLFRDVFGKSEIKPKHHYALHIPQMLATHQVLQPTMVHERRHKQYKEVAAAVKTGEVFSMGCTKLLLNRQLGALQEPSMFCTGTHILEPNAIPNDVLEILPAGSWVSAKILRRNGISSSIGDLVAVDANGSLRIMIVAAVLQHNNCAFYLLGTMCTSEGPREWKAGGLELCSGAACRGPCIWSKTSNGLYHVLMPGHIKWQNYRKTFPIALPCRSCLSMREEKEEEGGGG